MKRILVLFLALVLIAGCATQPTPTQVQVSESSEAIRPMHPAILHIIVGEEADGDFRVDVLVDRLTKLNVRPKPALPNGKWNSRRTLQMNNEQGSFKLRQVGVRQLHDKYCYTFELTAVDRDKYGPNLILEFMVIDAKEGQGTNFVHFQAFFDQEGNLWLRGMTEPRQSVSSQNRDDRRAERQQEREDDSVEKSGRF